MPNSNTVVAKPEATASATRKVNSRSSEWRPGFRQTPWPAMVLIFTMLASMGALAGIIAGSDKQTVESWKVGPSVLLSLLSSIWNYALSALLGISVVLTWWRNALEGTTLKSLHYIWDQPGGLNIYAGLRSTKARKVVLLAWLVGVVQIVSGPLLQRSTSVVSKNLVIEDHMTLNMTQRLQDGWTGVIVNASEQNIIGSRNGIATIQEWWKNATIWTSTSNNTGSQCYGTCEGTVQGTGIAYTCTSTLLALNLSQQENVGSTLFAINTAMVANETGAPVLALTTLYTSAIDNSCMATLNITTCNIEAAIVEYPVVIQNNTVTLDMEKLHSATIVSKFVSEGDLPTATPGSGSGPLQGLDDFFGYYLWANTTLAFTTRNTSTYTNLQGGGNMIPDLFFVPESTHYDPSILRKCGLKWSSPTQFVLDSMSDWLFRASLSSSNGTNSQTFSVQRTSPALIFQTDYKYLAISLVVMLLALLGVVFQLWGFWRLGRQVTMSPLEIAKAFKAPVMQQVNHISAVDGILKEVGKKKVKYDGESFHEVPEELRERQK